MDKRAILWPVLISVIIHMTLLGVAGMINLNDYAKPLDVLSVSISDPESDDKPEPVKKNKEVKKDEAQTKSDQSRKEKGDAVKDHGWREDTVDLGTLDVKYVPYLTKVKNRILRIWVYPQKAYENIEEGNVVVKMSIDANGTLAGVTLLSSSGSQNLDQGALRVVQDAAPYEPLPANYDLSRLHIIASFNYKITD
ncbi:MAG TPA: energy transducer TonB [Smithella sp.]|nr:energy transducer TonB [Smithella sp.]HQI73944.1 energy transducer TonB [Smithella sp.]